MLRNSLKICLEEVLETLEIKGITFYVLEGLLISPSNAKKLREKLKGVIFTFIVTNKSLSRGEFLFEIASIRTNYHGEPIDCYGDAKLAANVIHYLIENENR